MAGGHSTAARVRAGAGGDLYAPRRWRVSAARTRGGVREAGDAAKSADPQLQDTSSRLLGKWNGVEAAPVLLDLAKTAPAEKYQIRALRGYIGLARKFAMSHPERAKMCQSALNAASRIDEKRLVLDVMKLHPSHATLKLAKQAKQDPQLAEAATAAAVEITKKLRAKGIVVKE